MDSGKRQDGGIQLLLSAEQEAQQIITAARNCIFISQKHFNQSINLNSKIWFLPILRIDRQDSKIKAGKGKCRERSGGFSC